MTAGELAERFGVSRRTIHRDMDILSSAGVPVFAEKGSGGGFSIMEEYTLSRAVFSQTERDGLLNALSALKAAQYPETERLIEKLGAVFRQTVTNDRIEIDFSPWGSAENKGKQRLEVIRNALRLRKVISFEYVNAEGGRSVREAEPDRLIFRDYTWYLYAFCRKRDEYRTFRISRMKDLIVSDETCPERSVMSAVQNNAEEPAVKIVLRFNEKILSRIWDFFDDSLISRTPDGDCLLETELPDSEWVYSFFLSLGSNAEVIEPPHIRKEVARRLREALIYYTD
ncbi:MAG: YafY family transcriptional regulator [Geovibrio sp.]|nr:YafY family transcriptional regulator [Geovibrio sp.]MCD8569051.1 YafY family transcriptional regulator [Geovibrio sp.]